MLFTQEYFYMNHSENVFNNIKNFLGVAESLVVAVTAKR